MGKGIRGIRPPAFACTAPERFFITRAKKKMDFAMRIRQAADAGSGVKSDRLIRLRGPKSQKFCPYTLRLIRYADPDTSRQLKFLTNNLLFPAASVALLYRKRWRIQLFFKWIKQHPHIKAFRRNPQRRQDLALDGGDRPRVVGEAEASSSTVAGGERNPADPQCHDSQKALF
jgi:hypothetical protein